MPHHSTPGDDPAQHIDRFSPTRRGFVKAAGATAIGGSFAASTVGSTTAQEGSSNAPPALERESRDSNLIVDPDGNRVTLTGVNAVDPYRAARDAPHYKVRVEEYVKMATDEANGWHADVVRIPVQPNDIAREGAGAVEPLPYTEEQLLSYLEHYLDPVIQECANQGVYCILDYHRHWPAGPRWDDPEMDEELRMFWEIAAPRYDDQSHVIYELYNEPTEPYAGYDLGPANDIDVTDPEGEQTWLDWRETAQPWVDTVREYSDNLLLIGSPRWSQWTYWAPEHEFEGENLAYVGHFYTQGGLRPLDTYFGEPSEEVPVFITEFGWGGDGEHMSGTADEHYDEFSEFFAEYDALHWTGWCFDFDWEPSMLDRNYEIKNEWGEWIQTHLDEWNDRHPYPDPTAGTEAPSAPTNLTADVSTGGVELDWSGDDAADHYNVYVDTGLYDSTSSAPATVTEIEEGDIQLFGVNAQNGGGTSATTEIEVITDPDDGTGDEGPSAPGDAWVDEVTETTIEIGWEAVSEAEEYNVYLDGDHYDETADTAYVIVNLDPDTTYDVGVEAANEDGTSLTVEVTATTDFDGDTDSYPCEAHGAISEQLENGDWVCDLNGDGTYRDVTASGDTTTQDLQHFFENQHQDPWNSRPDLFDFTGNDDVGQPDVVDLFHDI